jgi:hypothetical protein
MHVVFIQLSFCLYYKPNPIPVEYASSSIPPNLCLDDLMFARFSLLALVLFVLLAPGFEEHRSSLIDHDLSVRQRDEDLANETERRE